jgi:hypothetical protein
VRKTINRVPTAGHQDHTAITLLFRDDRSDDSPTAATVRYGRWRMPREMPVFRQRGEDPAIDAAQDLWDEQEELVRRGVLAELGGYVRGCLDHPLPADITWTRDGDRLVADCTLYHKGIPVDLAIDEPGQ